MSTIKKMSIRGIRSFGTDQDDEQLIKFDSPLTLILGQNGCGKTTIIECLKYAITGEMPPGSNKGQSFVHDPKVNRTAECRGQIKLLVEDLRGNELTVTRTVQTTQRFKKLEFKSIDAAIKLKTKEGQNTTLSKRCIDTDVEMCEALGVSKPILNSVIFCHQEDSNWPLDEGKKLKERFDAIFDATKYNKCLENILKLRKTKVSNHKVMEKDVAHTEHIKQEAVSKRAKLADVESKKETALQLIQNIEEKIGPVKKRLIQIQVTENNILSLVKEQQTLQTRLESCQAEQESLTRKIKDVFEGSTSHLEMEIESFAANMTKQKRELDSLTSKERKAESKDTEIQKDITAAEIAKAALLSLRGQEQELLECRNRSLQRLAESLGETAHTLEATQKLYEIDTVRIDDTTSDVSELFDLVKLKIKRLNFEAENMMKDHEARDHQLQDIIDKLRDKRTTLIQDRESKTSHLNQLEVDCRKFKSDIDKIDSSASKLEQLAAKIQTVNNDIDQLSAECNVDDLKRKIATTLVTRNKYEQDLDRIEKQIQILQAQSKVTAELDMQKQMLSSKQAEARRIKNKHEDDLSRLFGESIPTMNYKMAVQGCYEKFSAEVRSINKMISGKEHQIISLENNRKHQKEQLLKTREELSNNEEKVYELCEGRSYEDVINQLQDSIQEKQMHRGTLASSEFMFKQYVKLLGRSQPACPLCHRDFDAAQEAAELTNDLNSKLRHIPAQLVTTDEILKKEQTKYDSLMALRPINEKIISLKAEIPNQQEKLKKTEAELQSLKSDIEGLKMSVCEPQSNMELANLLTADMAQLDATMLEINRFHREVSKLQSRLPDGAGDNSLEDLQTEQSVLKAELNQARSEVESMQNKLTAHSEKLQTLKELRNNLVGEQLALQSGVQARSQLVASYEKIQGQLGDLSMQLAQLEEELSPLKKQLEEATNNKNRTKDKNRSILNEQRTRIVNFQKQADDISKDCNSLENLALQNIQDSLDAKINSMRVLVAEKDKFSLIRKKIMDEMNRLKDKICTQEVRERDLKDNLDLRRKQLEAMELQTSLDELNVKMGDHDSKNVMAEKTSLIRTHTDLIKKSAENRGEITVLEASLKSLQSELNSDMYKNAERIYLDHVYQLHVDKLMANNLHTFASAMDWALMQYHKEKMDKINELIRELWRTIYRGNDIDYIEIKTDESEITSTSRRAYNYRVVQRKNDVEIDMRGRCSAGQRVLASLIIRIALAETFSTNCGILALDEPTTNLDRDNITSLCEALAHIVETRMVQKNFMLIVITHDEEFLDALTKVEKMERYHKITRNRDGKSRIVRMSIER